ncbi:MAG: aminotransferase class I/II-fold pyridoxal phosphate-dependent enzyme [candidate division Zixibacteria bacterium]|nr:aminotransferase class I/II-fold pyridoxal phosphate-dependent enzyme [candidate division Zixibacteria bacterium]
MTSHTTFGDAQLDELSAMVTRKVTTNKSGIYPFVDFRELMTELLCMFYSPGSHLISAGHFSPEVAQAADRAEIELVEQLGTSPFTGDLDSALSRVSSPGDIIYVANPNRMTGSNFSLSDLEAMARAVPNGVLIIDEYYYDYFGISGLPLLDILTNVVILRSFTASFSIGSSDAGYAIATPEIVDNIRQSCGCKKISLTVRKTIMAAMGNSEAMANRLQEVHDESLRITTALTRLGVQCRICATDFILIRVADHKCVGNYLASVRIPIENLDGYPQLKNYIRYQIQSYLSNDRLIKAFQEIPGEYLRMKLSDKRAVRLRKGSHASNSNADDRIVERETLRKVDDKSPVIE